MRKDWRTPRYITKALGDFDLDPCANINHALFHANCGYTEGGLDKEWFGRVWLNPPYGADAKIWMAKLAEHGHGIALIPPRMGSRWFHEVVLDKCDAILFLKGRIAFTHPDTGKPIKGNNSDSCLIAYGAENIKALESSKHDGEIWVIRS